MQMDLMLICQQKKYWLLGTKRGILHNFLHPVRIRKFSWLNFFIQNCGKRTKRTVSIYQFYPQKFRNIQQIFFLANEHFLFLQRINQD